MVVVRVSALMPSRRLVVRFVVVLSVIAPFVGAMAAAAEASGYWNVWQADLPDSNGVRTKVTALQVPGGTNNLRLSWDSSSNHDMHFTLIANNGSWYNSSAFAGAEYGTNTPYDRTLEYFGNEIPSGVAKAGCQNPAGLSTVWTNCRNAEFL